MEGVVLAGCIPIWAGLLFFHELEKWLANFYYFPWTFLFYSSSLPLGSHDVMCATFNKGEKTETLQMLSHDIFLTQQNIHDPYGKNTQVPLLVILNI